MSLNSPSIRPCQAVDLDQLLQLERACFSSDLLSRRRMRHWTTAANAIMPGAFDGAQLLGYALCFYRRNSKKLRFYSLAVAPQARGRGVALALMENLEARAKKLGLDEIWLEVAVQNHRAIGLYEQMGYQRRQLRAGYYEDGSDALRMSKSLGT